MVGEGECTWGGTDIDNVEDLLNITTKAAGPFCVDWSDLLDGVKRLDDEFGEQLEIWMEKLSNEDENIPDSQLDDGSPEPVQAGPKDSSSASSQAEPKENPSPSQAPAEPGSNAEKMRRIYANNHANLDWEEACRREAEEEGE